MKVLKEKKILIPIIVVALVTMIGIIVGFCIRGANNSSDTEDISENSEEIAEKLDSEDIYLLEEGVEREFTILELAFGEEEKPDYLMEMEDKSKYEIVSMEQDGNFIAAIAKVSAPDIYTIAKNLKVEGELTEEKIDAALTEALKNAQLTETEVPLHFEYVNGEWKMVMTKEFTDAYYGGILRLREEYYQNALGGTEDEK